VKYFKQTHIHRKFDKSNYEKMVYYFQMIIHSNKKHYTQKENILLKWNHLDLKDYRDIE